MTSYPAGRRLVPLLLIAIAGLILLGQPQRANAHAALETSDPGNGDVLASAPASVSATYTEHLEQSYSRLELYDSAGVKVEGTELSFGSDGYTMSLALPAGLPNGTYSILWRTLSEDDGHTAQNYFAFTIGTNVDIAPVVIPGSATDSEDVPQWAKTMSRWAALLGVSALIACWPVWFTVIRPSLGAHRRQAVPVVRRMRRFVVVAVAMALLGSLAALAVQAWTLPEGTYLDKVMNTLGQTRYGHLWLARVGLIIALGLVLAACGWWFTRRRQMEGSLAFALAAAVTLPFSLIAHASAQTHGRTVAVLADAAHLAASATWAGGIVLFVAVLFPSLRRMDADDRLAILRGVLPRFSTMALICMAVIGVTGFYSGWLEVGNLHALTSTAYGTALIWKLVLLALILVLAAVNLVVIERKLTARETSGAAGSIWSRRLRWTIGGELVGIVLLLAAVGQMTSLQPARDVVEETSRQVRVEINGESQEATLFLAPGIAGQNHFRVEIDGPPLPADTEGLLRLSIPANPDLGTKEIPLSRVAGNAFEHHGSELSIAAEWNVAVIVREKGKAPITIEGPVTIGTERQDVDVPGDPWRFDTLSGVTGLALALLGVASAIVGVRSARPVTRKESIGLGGAALLLGAILLMQARIDPILASLEAGDAIDPTDVAMVERGEEIYAQQCLSCHGAELRGDGPASPGMQPPPADFSDPHTSVHSESDLIYWVRNGKQGTAMPGFDNTLSDQDIRDVLSYIAAEQEQMQGGQSTPEAVACTVAPVTIEELESREGASAPEAIPPDEVGVTGPASSEQVAAVTAATNELVACTNAMDTMRRLSLFSNRSLTVSFGAGIPEGFAEAVAAPPQSLPADQRLSVTSISDVQVLDDGRIVATVQVEDPAHQIHALAEKEASGSTATTARLVFIQEGGRWLIDDIEVR